MEESMEDEKSENTEKKTLWDYFNKCISNDNGRRAQCVICNNVYSYISTTHNLKTHLLKVHKISLDETDSRRNKKPSKPKRCLKPKIFNHFTVNDDDKVATCNYCGNDYSYKSTSCNLSSHLSRKHPAVFAKLFPDRDEEEELAETDLSILYDADSDDDTKVFEVSSFFDQESSEWAMCRICKATVSNREQALMKHIEKHPKLLKGVQDSDAQNDDDEQETYTEVVYLDDFDGKRDKKEKSQWQADTSRTSTKPWKKRRRRVSSSSEDEPVEKRKKKSEKKSEITIFGEYIMCLIEKLPPDVCKRTQMNIINVVMNAYLENGSSSDKTSEVMTQDNAAPEVILTENGVVQEIQVDECSDNA